MRRAKLWALALLVFLLAGCGGKKKLSTDFTPPPPAYALESADTGPLADVTERLRPRLGPDESGFLLVDESAEALRWRLMLIDSARTSLEIQYYFWFGDDAGMLLMDRVLAAADRGVRVRILLVDIKIKGAESDEWGAIVEQHPNMSFKIFNPWLSRKSAMPIGEFVGSMRRLNQRMHNKVMLADGHLAIVGGRNLGDHYWGLGENFNNVDLDLLVAGPVIDEIEEEFDLYWNHELVYPVEVMDYEVTPAQLEEVRAEVARDVEGSRDVLAAFSLKPRDWSERLDELPDRMILGRSWVVYDEPATDRRSRPSQVYGTLAKTIGEVLEQEIVIASAYFIPQQEFIDETLELVDRGVKVKILTNSLASNQNTVSHAGYKRYRRALLLAGADLYELRPDGKNKSDYETPPREGEFIGLHTKAFVMDRKYSFVGTLNLDPRSAIMNTEVGIVVESEELAAQVLEAIERSMTPGNSWHVILNDKKRVEWVSEDGVLHKEPARARKQRFAVWFIGVYANENWL